MHYKHFDITKNDDLCNLYPYIVRVLEKIKLNYLRFIPYTNSHSVVTNFTHTYHIITSPRKCIRQYHL